MVIIIIIIVNVIRLKPSVYKGGKVKIKEMKCERNDCTRKSLKTS